MGKCRADVGRRVNRSLAGWRIKSHRTHVVRGVGSACRHDHDSVDGRVGPMALRAQHAAGDSVCTRRVSILASVPFARPPIEDGFAFARNTALGREFAQSTSSVSSTVSQLAYGGMVARRRLVDVRCLLASSHVLALQLLHLDACLALLGSLLVGAFQARENNYKIYAFLSAGSKNLPEFVGDLFGKKSVLGLGGYQRLSSTSDVIDEPSFWYEPTDAPIRLFAGFLDATHWAAAATIMLPLLLAGSVLAANRHRQLGSGGWSASSLGLLAVACGLALGIAFFADLGLATLGAIALVVGCAVFMSAPAVRFGLIARCLLLGMILVGGAAIRISRDGGLPVLKEQALQWKTESKAMLSAFNEHWLTGSGIGSFHVVWPIYRPFPRRR